MSVSLHRAAFEVKLVQTLVRLTQLGAILHDHHIEISELAGLDRINAVDTSKKRLALMC